MILPKGGECSALTHINGGDWLAYVQEKNIQDRFVHIFRVCEENGLQAAKATGQLTLQKVLDMQEAGVEVESFVSEDMRLQMYTKEVPNPSPNP